MENNSNVSSKHLYEIPPTTINLKTHTEYLFSLCYNLETNNNDEKIHYYAGRYRKEKNGAPVFDCVIDTETNKYLGKKIIENFVMLEPQILKYMGVFRGKIRQEQEELKIKNDKERGYLSVEEMINAKTNY
jgi:hypothetical protein